MVSMMRGSVALLLLYSSVIAARWVLKSWSDAHLIWAGSALFPLPLAARGILNNIDPLFGRCICFLLRGSAGSSALVVLLLERGKARLFLSSKYEIST